MSDLNDLCNADCSPNCPMRSATERRLRNLAADRPATNHEQDEMRTEDFCGLGDPHAPHSGGMSGRRCPGSPATNGDATP